MYVKKVYEVTLYNVADYEPIHFLNGGDEVKRYDRLIPTRGFYSKTKGRFFQFLTYHLNEYQWGIFRLWCQQKGYHGCLGGSLPE